MLSLLQNTLKENEKNKEHERKSTDRSALYKAGTEITDGYLMPACRKLHADKAVLDLPLLCLHTVYIDIPAVFEGNRDEEQSVFGSIYRPVDPVIPDLV